MVDCSANMSGLFNDEATPKTVASLNRFARETALVSAWWFIQIPTCWGERKGCIKPTQSDALIADLGKLGMERTMKLPSAHYTPIGTLPHRWVSQL